MAKIAFLFLGGLLAFLVNSTIYCQTINWSKADTGLYVGNFISPIKSTIGNSEITIVKINPKLYDFHIATAKEHHNKRYTVEQWCKLKGYIGAVNTGMFSLKDGLSNVGYMKRDTHINNKEFQPDFCSFLCYNPNDSTLPLMQILELCTKNDPQWSIIEKKYGSVTQSLRMINKQGTNVWAQSYKMWSMVVWGMDKSGNALWIFTRSPFTVHTFINILKQAPLNIQNMMYLEGGPEGSLYFQHNGITLQKFGSYETGFFEKDTNDQFWPVPNVIGITKKKRK